MSLVLGKLMVAERRSGPIKGHSDIVGFDFCQRFNEDGGKAKCRIDDLSFACSQVFWYGVEGAA